MARHGGAKRGQVRHGEARHGAAWHGRDSFEWWRNRVIWARPGCVGCGEIGSGEVLQGLARDFSQRLFKERHR